MLCQISISRKLQLEGEGKELMMSQDDTFEMAVKYISSIKHNIHNIFKRWKLKKKLKHIIFCRFLH